MPISRKRLAKELLKATYEFHSLRPWERFTNRDLVAMRIPGRDHPVLASIMGSGGQEFGISVYLGEDAAERLFESFEDELPQEDAMEAEHFVGCGMSP